MNRTYRVSRRHFLASAAIATAAGTVTSVIKTGSVQRMNLKEDDTVFAITKATEVSVQKE